MTSAREELIQIINQLPDDKVEFLLGQARASEEKGETPKQGNWHIEMRELRAKLARKYGTFPDSQTLIEEMNEERLDDIMGSSGF